MITSRRSILDSLIVYLEGLRQLHKYYFEVFKSDLDAELGVAHWTLGI